MYSGLNSYSPPNLVSYAEPEEPKSLSLGWNEKYSVVSSCTWRGEANLSQISSSASLRDFMSMFGMVQWFWRWALVASVVSDLYLMNSARSSSADVPIFGNSSYMCG